MTDVGPDPRVVPPVLSAREAELLAARHGLEPVGHRPTFGRYVGVQGGYRSVTVDYFGKLYYLYAGSNDLKRNLAPNQVMNHELMVTGYDTGSGQDLNRLRAHLERAITAVNLLETTVFLMAQTAVLVAQTGDEEELVRRLSKVRDGDFDMRDLDDLFALMSDAGTWAHLPPGRHTSREQTANGIAAPWADQPVQVSAPA